MGTTNMKRVIQLTGFCCVIFCLKWILVEASVQEEVYTTTRTPVKLSAILKNISLYHQNPTDAPISEPNLSASSTLTTTTEVPIRRRVSTRIRKVNRGFNSTLRPFRPFALHTENAASPRSKSRRESSRESTSLKPISKISGMVKGGKDKPEDLIRSALINHTLEHGGEQDLDKLVFSNLPNGSKLVFRTVKIVRTDEDGNPADETEDAQPTFFDVTLANVTGLEDNDNEEDDYDENSDSEESGDEESGTNGEKARNASDSNVGQEATTREIAYPVALKAVEPEPSVEGRSEALKKVRRGGKKRPDLESSGSHSAVNYHNLNDYGTTGREKEHGTTNFHGNTHGNSHRQTYTETDGKDVKPYHGTEKGLTHYANEHGKNHKDQGERFKTSKRKNKGRKVTGFKRVYHKEEYQRTEHFYDDEEAKKIAESFGLHEAKEGSKHGTKDDKRKFQGVHTEYLDGKKHENEHGTHDGYNKGTHSTYKDSEKHSHHNNYGKSHSQGSLPQQNHHAYDDYQYNHHHNNHQNNHQQHQSDYHPNHNYHASYSNLKQNTIAQAPKTLTDQFGGTRSIAAIISAPMAHSFSVTEYSPLVAESVTSKPKEQFPLQFYPMVDYDKENSTAPLAIPDDQAIHHNDNNEYKRRRPFRKRPRERKIFYSPKHRVVKEHESPQQTDEQLSQRFTALPPRNPTPESYQVLSSITQILDNNEKERERGQVAGEVETKYTPYAPNFGPPKDSPQLPPSTQYLQAPPQEHNRGIESHHPHPPSKVHWHTHHHRDQKRGPRNRNRPVAYAPHHTHTLTSTATGYPPTRNHHHHLASIPFRHASAFHRLGNRHQRYQTLRHHPKHHHPLHFYEISTRKSDTVVGETDNGTALYRGSENDSAHYFNHNHRYAKNHLTSTINPLKSSSNSNSQNQGVRNTLFDPVPGVYSTVVKVFPATMLSINDSKPQLPGIVNDQHYVSSDAVKYAGQASTVTHRPLTQADTVSITTAYPMHHAPPQPHQNSIRQFMPKIRWLTYTLALPDLKLGNDFGSHSHHPHRVKKGSYLMNGIKNGILNPFNRGRQTLLASPASHHNFQGQVLPYHHGPQVIMHKRPHHPIFAHNVASYGNGLQFSAAPYAVQAASPSQISIKKEKPKFYYKPNDGKNVSRADAAMQRQRDTTQTSGDSKDIKHKPTLRVSQKTGSTVANGENSTTNKPESGKQPKTSTSPPFVNGIMDSVSGFFGKIG